MNGTVTIVTVPPEWRDVQPQDGLITEDRRLAFHGVPFGGSGGVDLASVRVFLGSEDVTSQARISATSVDFTPSADLADGFYRYQASFANLAGRTVFVERNFRVVSAVGPVDPSAGGTVRVEDPANPLFGVSLTYPPGVAPPGTTAIISIPETIPPLPEGATAVGTAADIEANPSTFASPVTLTLVYSEADLAGYPETELSVAFFDEAIGQWQLVQDFTVDVQNNLILVSTMTLSKWVLIRAFDLFGIDRSRSTVEVIPAVMEVDDDAAREAMVRVTPRRSFDGALLGPGQRVTVQLLSGSGVLGPVVDLGNGIYEADLNAPTTAGTARLRAIVNGVVLEQQPTATYVAGPAVVLLFALVPLKVESGQPFQLAIVALDRFGNVATGYAGPAEFASTDPLATVNGQPANGVRTNFLQGQTLAQVVLRTAGTQTLRIQDVANPSVAGQVSILVGAGAAALFTVIGGDGQTGLTGDVLSQPLQARLTDAAGNPLAGRFVQVRVTSGGGAAQFDSTSAPPPQPITVATGTNGVATAFWRLGLVAGAQALEMQPEGTSLVARFTATAILRAPTLTRPAEGLKTFTRTVRVEGTAPPGSTVEVRANGVAVASTPADGAGIFSVRTAPLAEGTNRITAMAWDAAGNVSAESNARNILVDLTAPAAPSGVSLIEGNGYLELRWNPNQEADLLGYLVFRRGPGDADFTQVTTGVLRSATFRDTGVVNGQAYRYRVRAVDDAVEDAP